MGRVVVVVVFQGLQAGFPNYIALPKRTQHAVIETFSEG
jgi:hypothetical protein